MLTTILTCLFWGFLFAYGIFVIGQGIWYLLVFLWQLVKGVYNVISQQFDHEASTESPMRPLSKTPRGLHEAQYDDEVSEEFAKMDWSKYSDNYVKGKTKLPDGTESTVLGSKAMNRLRGISKTP